MGNAGSMTVTAERLLEQKGKLGRDKGKKIKESVSSGYIYEASHLCN